MRHTCIMIFSMLVALALSGCNTVDGIGKDLKQGGQAIEWAVKK